MNREGIERREDDEGDDGGDDNDDGGGDDDEGDARERARGKTRPMRNRQRERRTDGADDRGVKGQKKVKGRRRDGLKKTLRRSGRRKLEEKSGKKIKRKQRSGCAVEGLVKRQNER